MNIKGRVQSLKQNLKRFYNTRIKHARHEELTQIKKELLFVKNQMERVEGHTQLLENTISVVRGLQEDSEFSNNQLRNVINEVFKIQDDLKYSNNQLRNIINEVFKIQDDLKYSKDQLHRVYCIEKENQWANRFHDAIRSSEWLNADGMAPGGFAAGYQLLYLLFKILDIKKPLHILDIGLGQTTQMISMYVENNPSAEHLTIEGDPSFIEFWCKNHYLSTRTKIMQMNYGFQEYSKSEVRVFEGFREQLINKKFDLIIIDAPFGGDMKEFSRIDILECIPECLADDFIIILDDTHRRGESNTGKALEEKLRNNDFPFVKGRYIGETMCTIWTSTNNVFLCTL